MGVSLIAALATFAGLLMGATPFAAGDTIVLRDFETLNDVVVVSFDDDGVRLVGSRRLDWGEIRFGQVSAEKQADFDRLLSELGPQLYRLRYRLTIQDNASLGAIAQPLSERFAGSSSSAAQLVQLALFRYHMSRGERARALVHWLALQRPFDGTIDPRSPQFHWPQAGEAGLWDPQLVPVWFDTQESAEVLALAIEQLEQLPAPPAVCRMYVASLALAAGEVGIAQEQLRTAEPENSAQREWSAILRLQEARMGVPGASGLAPMEARLESMLPELRCLALYEIGLTKLNSGSPASSPRGMIDLLRIPAELSEVSPELAAASLWHVAQAMKLQEQSVSAQRLERELIGQFPESWYARQLESSGLVTP